MKYKKDISIIIRTYNEEKFLKKNISSILKQEINQNIEIFVVDSGSTDNTIKIVNEFNIKLLKIKKKEFTYGRSLNIGCEKATGKILVFLSAHCIPKDKYWLQKLVSPLLHNKCDFTYGRQLGGKTSFFSEIQIFKKYYPNKDQIPQNSFYCNNANAAVKKNVWKKYKFDENLSGLEDIEFGIKLINNNLKIGYCSRASVYHYHQETWRQIKNRFERESYALSSIIPNSSISIFSFIKLTLTSIYQDIILSRKLKKDVSLKSIIFYRLAQYYGSYIGGLHKKNIYKFNVDEYFYPSRNSH
tara:strand:- start:1376 stop:2275 length:900 start_codon:yes stop_codon:yes gene_type:complete